MNAANYRSFERIGFSQITAQFFRVVGFILLIPGSLMTLFSVIYPPLLLISVPIFAVGCILLNGYCKHSRGNLSESKILWLWVGTFIFNVIPLLLCAYGYSTSPNRVSLSDSFDFYVLMCEFIISWWLLSVILSAAAFFDKVYKR